MQVEYELHRILTTPNEAAGVTRFVFSDEIAQANAFSNEIWKRGTRWAAA
jgi:hypothetical protein